jgi:hypothetical protein
VNSVKERAALTKKTTKTTKKKCRAIETTSEERKESDKKKTSIHRKTVKNVKGHQQDETVEKGGARTSQQRGAGVLAAWGAIGHSQRKRHHKWALLLRGMKSAGELVDALEDMRTQRDPPLKWSTMNTKIGELFGTLRRCDTYGLQAHMQQILATAVFRDYRRHVENMMLQEMPDYPLPLQKYEVAEMLEGDRLRPEAKDLLAFMWATTCRPNCGALLETANVQIRPDKKRQGAALSALFVKGKGVLARRTPYVVHTRLEGEAFRLAETRLDKARKANRKALFTPTEQQKAKRSLAKALKENGKELRSVRRGSLETMAKAGASLETLMTFSGHKRVETLLRYLRWGLVAETTAIPARRAARALY